MYRPESCYSPAVLLRGIIAKFFSVPAKPARRFALSLAMSACKPSLTRDVFSEIPVNFAAFSSKLSSILSVVLIEILLICRMRYASICTFGMHLSRHTAFSDASQSEVSTSTALYQTRRHCAKLFNPAPRFSTERCRTFPPQTPDNHTTSSPLIFPRDGHIL